MSHSFSSLFYHCIWSTKDRYPWLTQEICNDVYRYINGITKQKNTSLIDIGGRPDHVHVLIASKPTIQISELLRTIKGGSSHFLHENFPQMQKFGWQEGYGVFSVSLSMVDTVQEYIKKQQDHHKKVSFYEEYIGLLKKHGIIYDEKFLF